MSLNGEQHQECADAILSDVVAALRVARVLPVVVLDDADDARTLAGALRAGGISCAEVTFRTDAAEAGIMNMAGLDDFLVGAGTVVSSDQVDRAVAAGASFIVSPGFSATVVHRARELGVPVFPGVATPTEIQMAFDSGQSILKLFPAEALGGVAMLDALAPPFPSVRFIPTGGIRISNLSSYLARPSVLAVGGSWMVKRSLVQQRRWTEVERLTSEATSHVSEARE